MTDQYEPAAASPWGAPIGPPAGTAVVAAANPPEPPRTARDSTRADVRFAVVIVAVLAVLGAGLGLLWAWWSGPQQRAFVIAPGKLYPFDEVETMGASDGRYLALVAAAGLVAGVVVWAWRRHNRGPVALLALCIGGLAGAALTAWVGHLTGGGTFDGRAGTTIAHLPLSLHMRGLLFAEPALSALLYGLFVAFAARDDLGRPDPVRDQISVGAGDHPQHGGGYGDAPGALQQGDFPPQ